MNEVEAIKELTLLKNNLENINSNCFDLAIKALKFQNYFMELYGEGLEVANWHLNGYLESLDNFIESGLECE